MIQKIELTRAYEISIHCPFCGQKVEDMEAGQTGEVAVNPCPHTLFACNDEGFEYRSEIFDKALDILNVEDDDIELPEGGYDELTDKIAILDSIKIATYIPPPAAFGSYIGFAPLDSEID